MKKFFFIFFLFLLPTIFFGCTRSKVILDGGVFVSLDEAETWAKRSFVGFVKKQAITLQDYTINDLTFDPENFSVVYAATAQNGLYRTENNGEVWAKTGLSGNVRHISINPKNPEIIFAVRGSSVYKSIDGAKEWTTVYTDSFGATLTDVYVDEQNPTRVFVSTSNGDMLRSNDNGNNWKVLFSFASAINRIVPDKHNNQILYVLLKGGWYQRSADGGETWTDFSSNPSLKEVKVNKALRFFVLDPKDSKHIIAGSDGVIESRDGGETWQDMQTLLTNKKTINAFAIDPTDSQKLYFAVGKLIHKSDNGGKNWRTRENFPSTRSITTFLINPEFSNVLYAGTLKPAKK